MFGGREVVHSDLEVTLQVRTKRVLMTLSDMIVSCCQSEGLSPRHTPYGRPSSFMVILEPMSIQLVLNGARISAMPNHTYRDRRSKHTSYDMDSVVRYCEGNLGFAESIGIELPIGLLDVPPRELQPQLRPIATDSCHELLGQARMTHLGLPDTFRSYGRPFYSFLQDHPTPEKTAFLTMRGGSSPLGERIEAALRRETAKSGLELLRSENKEYVADPWQNACLYMLGCTRGVAVLGVPREDDSAGQDPSTALELGFMLALGRPCLVLHGARRPEAPDDLIAKISRPLDLSDLDLSIGERVQEWADQIGLK